MLHAFVLSVHLPLFVVEKALQGFCRGIFLYPCIMSANIKSLGRASGCTGWSETLPYAYGKLTVEAMCGAVTEY